MGRKKSKEATKNKTLQVRFTAELLSAFEDLARVKRTSTAEIIRAYVTRLVAANKQVIEEFREVADVPKPKKKKPAQINDELKDGEADENA